MENNCCYIPYSATGYFSTIAIDYIQQNPLLKPFYEYPVSVEGIKRSIEKRRSFPTNRKLLVQVLREQYNNIEFSEKQELNLQQLLQDNTFTITTAHQPNIFTGPLYFIYKILHVIKLADELTAQLPDCNFVPVYYMGSEDADFDELGYVTVGGEKLVWQTVQTGAVGRMKVDKGFLNLIQSIEGQIGIHTYGNELIQLFRQCYTVGKTIQQATLELVNALFADYGLLIVIPDNVLLKQSFENVVKKELLEQFSHKAVAATVAELSKNYKVQASGRELNLFYLIDDKRERIEVINSKFKIQNLKIEWSQEEILTELKQHPERFSANVILRGVFQETILPNIAFVGGGGELAYWLELKKVFEAVQVPYPMLLLRNSFLLLQKQQKEKAKHLGFNVIDFFQPATHLLNKWVKKNTDHQLSLEQELASIKNLYEKIQGITQQIDITLQHHTEALQTKALKRLNELEKKMLRAEKRKYETEQRQILQLKNELFPNNNLQEREENFSLYYAKYGKQWLNNLYKTSKGLMQEFGIVEMDTLY
jgi:bacillithiol biosynthesis cysteine-adding enzyme BshC